MKTFYNNIEHILRWNQLGNSLNNGKIRFLGEKSIEDSKEGGSKTSPSIETPSTGKCVYIFNSGVSRSSLLCYNAQFTKQCNNLLEIQKEQHIPDVPLYRSCALIEFFSNNSFSSNFASSVEQFRLSVEAHLHKVKLGCFTVVSTTYKKLINIHNKEQHMDNRTGLNVRGWDHISICASVPAHITNEEWINKVTNWI